MSWKILIVGLFLLLNSCDKNEKINFVNEKIVDEVLSSEKDTLINLTYAPLNITDFQYFDCYDEIIEYKTNGYFTNNSMIKNQIIDKKMYPNRYSKIALYYIDNEKKKAVVLIHSFDSLKNESLLGGGTDIKKCYFVKKILGIWFVEEKHEISSVQ